jgi:hypothetical protein
MDAPRSGNDLAAIDRRTADRQRSSRHALARPPRDDLVRKSRETDRGEIRETPESTRERESERAREKERERERGGEGRGGEGRGPTTVFLVRSLSKDTRDRAGYSRESSISDESSVRRYIGRARGMRCRGVGRGEGRGRGEARRWRSGGREKKKEEPERRSGVRDVIGIHFQSGVSRLRQGEIGRRSLGELF